MSGDSEMPPVEVDSKVSSIRIHSHAPVAGPGLETNIEVEENGLKFDGSICANGDSEPCGENEGEMKGQDEILNGEEDDVVENQKCQGGTGSIADNINSGEIVEGISDGGGENYDMDNDGKEVDEEEKEDEGEKENEFQVGRYVWGKIRNNPWWPGQIYDPSDASDYAEKLQKNKKLLVAFFGDGSFSWCSPSQLKPFAENFEKMSKQSSSSKFKYAVEEALNQFGRCIESNLSQSYDVSEENLSDLARPLVVNAGIRQGVLMPECDPSEIPQLEPVEITKILSKIAAKATFSSMLELTVLRSWIAAFYRANGKDELAMFNEPQGIEGLDDKGKDVVANSDLGSKESSHDDDSVPSQQELSVSNQAWLRKCEGIEAEKLQKRRKRKSVAKLMKGEIVEPNNENGNMANGLKSGKLKKRARKEEGPDESVVEVHSISGRKKGKKKPENIKSLEEVLNAERGGTKDVKIHEKDHGSSIKKDGRRKRLATNGNKKRSEMKKKVSIAEKVDKITIIETEDVAASEKKREGKSSDKVAKGKSVDKAGEDIATLPKRTARKRKQNETLDEIKKKKEDTKTRSKKKISNSEKDKQEETEIVLALSSQIVDTFSGETENGAASGKKRTTRSLVKGSIEESGNENLDQGEEALSSVLEKMRMKWKQTEKLESPKIKEIKENPETGGKEKVIGNGNGNGNGNDNEKQEEIENVLRSPRERKKSMYLSPPFINYKTISRSLSPNIARTETGGKEKVIGNGNDNEKQEEIENVLRSPRERKKSMYLSPPFINYKTISRSLSPNIARMGERMTRVASEVIGSTPTLNKSNEPLLDKVDTSSKVSQNRSPLKIIESVKIDVSIKEVVHEIRSRALNPVILSENDVLDKVEKFLFTYRNVKYLNGAYYKMYHNAQEGKKQNDKGADEEASQPVTLMVLFPSGFCLPSKTDLVSIFSKFGPVNEAETNISHESCSAMVVFLSNFDTEEAFNTCLEGSPFGSAKVKYRLCYSAGSSKANASEKKTDVSCASGDLEESQLPFIKQKLEIMTKMVDNCGGNMSNELITNLEDELKGLLNNISTITEKPTSA